MMKQIRSRISGLIEMKLMLKN